MRTLFISDTHFSHEATCLKFKRQDGSPLRPFSSGEEMDDFMIKAWNARVQPEDKVYHLGDVCMHKRALPILDRLNGRKTLIAGNHDIFNTKFYTKYFENVRAYKHYPEHGIIFSHIPVHPNQLESRFKFCVHGHLHANHVMRTTKSGKATPIRDERYLNICVEQTDYAPITFDRILEMLGLK